MLQRQNHGNSSFSACQGVMGADHALKPLARDMGIDLGCGDIRVPKHLLNRPEVGAMIDQMGREGMTQDVRAHADRIDAGDGGTLLEELGEALPGQMAGPGAYRWKQPWSFAATGSKGAPHRKIAAERGARRLGYWDQPVLFAFSADVQDRDLPSECGHRQADQLGDSKAAAIQKLNQRGEAQRGGGLRSLRVGGEQGRYLRFGQQLRQWSSKPGRIERGRGRS